MVGRQSLICIDSKQADQSTTPQAGIRKAEFINFLAGIIKQIAPKHSTCRFSGLR
jgi:hypothetical protein